MHRGSGNPDMELQEEINKEMYKHHVNNHQIPTTKTMAIGSVNRKDLSNSLNTTFNR